MDCRVKPGNDSREAEHKLNIHAPPPARPVCRGRPAAGCRARPRAGPAAAAADRSRRRRAARGSSISSTENGADSSGKGPRQRGASPALRAGEPQQRVAVADPVVQRRAVVEPDMRQPRARPGRRHVGHEIGLRRLARLRPDDRRADIAVAQLGADNLVALALLDVGDAREIGARRGAFRRVVADVRLVGRAPGAPAARGMARGLDIARADLPALDFVGAQQRRARPSPAASPRASRTDRWRRRRRCSCRARRSGSPDAPHRRRGRRAPRRSGPPAAGSAATAGTTASRI